MRLEWVRARITDRGAISFHVMRRLPGKPHPVRVVLGKYPSLSLAAARKQAGAALADLAAGIHPRERARALQTAEAQRKAVTVGHVVEDFASRHLSRKRTGPVVAQLLRRELVSRWGGRPITDITRADVIGMIEAVGDPSPSAARQAWLYTWRLFGWALHRGIYGLTASPCERVRIADLVGSPRPRERVLNSDELRAIWQITADGEFPFDPFVRLLLLLGCRRGELAGMRRDELDLAAGLWQLSGDRTKNEQARTIPLSTAGGRDYRFAASISRPVCLRCRQRRAAHPRIFEVQAPLRPSPGGHRVSAELDLA